MKMFYTKTVAGLFIIMFFTACDNKPFKQLPIVPKTETSQAPADALPQTWLGKWNGVEGTYLQLKSISNTTFEISIKNLDGERKFVGMGSTDHISFERDGAKETIRATSGASTGMKWFADKSNCLTIHFGEGYCRK